MIFSFSWIICSSLQNYWLAFCSLPSYILILESNLSIYSKYSRSLLLTLSSMMIAFELALWSIQDSIKMDRILSISCNSLRVMSSVSSYYSLLSSLWMWDFRTLLSADLIFYMDYISPINLDIETILYSPTLSWIYSVTIPFLGLFNTKLTKN